MIKILSIDGGGIRGIVALIILCFIEKTIGIPIYKLFDIIAGTSTGAIIASFLAIGIPADEVLKFYLGDEAKKIFSKTFWKSIGIHCPKYTETGIEQVLQSRLGTKTFANCLTGLVIPADNWAYRRGEAFSNLEAASRDVKLWEAVRASSAAETFFKAHNGMFDGGMYANNPVGLAISHAIKYKGVRTFDELFVVSLGTGTMVEPMKVKDVDDMGFAGIGMNIIPESMDRSTALMHDIFEPIFSMTPIKNYTRLQFDCPNNMEEMDNVSDKNLNNLSNLAESLIYNSWGKDIDYIISQLRILNSVPPVIRK